MKTEKAFHDFLPTTGTVKIETTVRLACISWVQQSADHLLHFPYTLALYGRYHWYGTELQILVPKARYLSAYSEYCSITEVNIFFLQYIIDSRVKTLLQQVRYATTYVRYSPLQTSHGAIMCFFWYSRVRTINNFLAQIWVQNSADLTTFSLPHGSNLHIVQQRRPSTTYFHLHIVFTTAEYEPRRLSSYHSYCTIVSIGHCRMLSLQCVYSTACSC